MLLPQGYASFRQQIRELSQDSAISILSLLAAVLSDCIDPGANVTRFFFCNINRLLQWGASLAYVFSDFRAIGMVSRMCFEHIQKEPGNYYLYLLHLFFSQWLFSISVCCLPTLTRALDHTLLKPMLRSVLWQVENVCRPVVLNLKAIAMIY